MVGTGHNATVRFFDVPIALLAVARVPAVNERKSGFLTPTLRLDRHPRLRSVGAVLPQPRAQLRRDAHAAADDQARDCSWAAQCRYLFETGTGRLEADYLPHDRRHRHQPLRAVVGSTTRISARSARSRRLPQPQQGLRRHVLLRSLRPRRVHVADDAAARGRLHVRQRALAGACGGADVPDAAGPESPPVTPPYNRVPQLAGSLQETDWMGLTFAGAAEYANFRQPTLDLPGSARTSIRRSPGRGRARHGRSPRRAGAHLRQYGLNEHAGRARLDPVGYAIPITSRRRQPRVRARLEGRSGTTSCRRWSRARSMSTCPYRNQNTRRSSTPRSTTSTSRQLFSVNRYLGNDRIGDANQLTLALTSRLLDPRPAPSACAWRSASASTSQDQQVTLDRGAAVGGDLGLAGAGVEGRLTDAWALAGLWQYNFDSSQTERFNAGAALHAGPGRVVQRHATGIRAAPTRSAPGSAAAQPIRPFGQWPVTANWTLLGRWNYSLAGPEDAGGGGGRRVQCRLLGRCGSSAQRLTTTTQTTTNSVYLQIELNGLARFGTSPLDLLRRSVPGYQQDERSDDRRRASAPTISRITEVEDCTDHRTASRAAAASVLGRSWRWLPRPAGAGPRADLRARPQPPGGRRGNLPAPAGRPGAARPRPRSRVRRAPRPRPRRRRHPVVTLDRVVAVVNDEALTQYDLDEQKRIVLQQMKARR